MWAYIFIFILASTVICEGVEFTFTDSARAKTPSCGRLRCVQTVSAGALTGLKVYKLHLQDGPSTDHWEQMAEVTSLSPSDNRTPDGLGISGQLSDDQGEIRVEMSKPGHCQASAFLCTATVVNGDERKVTLIKSVLTNDGGSFSAVSQGQGQGTTADDPVRENPPVREFPIDSMAEMLSRGSKDVRLVFALWEKMNYFEKRMDDFYRQERNLETKIENLKDSVKDLVGDRLQAIYTRLEDRLDTMENRLEDKLSSVAINASPRGYNVDVCTEFSSQISGISKSIGEMEKNLTAAVYKAQTSDAPPVSTIAQFGSKLDAISSGLSNVSGLTESVLSSLDELRQTDRHFGPVPVNEFFDALGTGRSEWRLVFRGTAHVGVALYAAYLYGTGIPPRVEPGCKQFNQSLACSSHYRNRAAMESWEDIDVKGQMVKNVVFNARGSNYINWFEANRVVSSSWVDLKTATHNYFSIAGHDSPNRSFRKFYISHLYNSCAGDVGWFAVSDMTNAVCPWEVSAAIPLFRFAPGNTMAKWSSPNFGRADAIGVYVKYH
ncbi:hypothetical protein EGW08_019872 [Elysia chlorotica]|uniref:Fibrinogen C-terminal domain-containing protein n=1 Tax=Elysia chlorotica TaxID=188477 RepID=A0A433SSX1_ELYCH|nr:hypothetical protein EGW08_019872 [Elysia chlorotica]